MNDDLEDFHEAVNSGEALRRESPVSEPDPPTAIQATKAMAGSGSIRAWALNGDHYYGISQSFDHLEPGCYRSQMSDQGIFLVRQDLHTDSLLTLPDSKSEAIVEEIRQFITLRPEFDKRGFIFKRGILLWGPPGSGKTSTLHLLMDLLVKRQEGIALIIDQPSWAQLALQLIRKIEPNRQVVCLLEDIDGLIHTYGIERYLALLDGEAQIDNVVFVATTNYPELLDKRLVDRPSRFDTVAKIGMPSAEARRAYLCHKEPDLASEVIDEMVNVSEGMSIAHLRELIILTQCFGRPLDVAAKALTASRKRAPSSERSDIATGFAKGLKDTYTIATQGQENGSSGGGA